MTKMIIKNRIKHYVDKISFGNKVGLNFLPKPREREILEIAMSATNEWLEKNQNYL